VFVHAVPGVESGEFLRAGAGRGLPVGVAVKRRKRVDEAGAQAGSLFVCVVPARVSRDVAIVWSRGRGPNEDLLVSLG
jgi:hypothetical protein